MNPLLSILIPIYNNEKTLHRMVDSILAQTFDDWELLLVNDGSQDSCPQIIDEYAKTDSRIRVFHKENAGTYSGYNLGVQQANGKYIVFGAADDSFEPTALQTIANQAREHDYDIIFINIKILNYSIKTNSVKSEENFTTASMPFQIIGKTNVEKSWLFLTLMGLLRCCVNAYKLSILKKYHFTDVYSADTLVNQNISNEIHSVSCNPEYLYNRYTYLDINDESKNISSGKFYDYEHDMFNEIYTNNKNIFARWNLLDTNTFKHLAIASKDSFMQYIQKVLYDNNPHTPAESINIVTNYYDDNLFEIAAFSDSFEEIDNIIFNTIMTIYQNAKSRVDSPIVNMYLSITDQKVKFSKMRSEIAKGLLDYRNPYRIGYEPYKALSKKYPKIKNENLIDYLEKERKARVFLFEGDFENALDTISESFNSTITTPEQYVILAVCGYYLNLSEDTLDAIQTGLSNFPDYPRLLELQSIVTSQT